MALGLYRVTPSHFSVVRSCLSPYVHICPSHALNTQRALCSGAPAPPCHICLPCRDLAHRQPGLPQMPSLLPPGALSEWLADHPVMINSVLPLVLHALGNPELSISSVSTLKKICRECKYDLPPYAANIVAVSQVSQGPGCSQASGHSLPCTDTIFLLFIPRMC